MNFGQQVYTAKIIVIPFLSPSSYHSIGQFNMRQLQLSCEGGDLNEQLDLGL